MEKKNILIVDDDELLCHALEKKFSDAGYETTVVHDGEKALKKLSEEEFDVVALDLHMQHIDGFEVLKQIKNTKNTKTPVYVITNLGKESYCDRAISLGAKRCFVKTHVTLQEVVDAIEKDVNGEAS